MDRLIQDGVHTACDCVMVCGKGFPDLVSRAAVWQLFTLLRCPVLALTDCNPAGVNVALAYKLPCPSTTLPEADISRFCECLGGGFGASRRQLSAGVSELVWLGVMVEDLEALSVPDEAWKPLTTTDTRQAEALQRRDGISQGLRRCVEAMVDKGKKADIEALYSSGMDVLGPYLLDKLARGSWVN
jgi:meiotic recombination protein SPO11